MSNPSIGTYCNGGAQTRWSCLSITILNLPNKSLERVKEPKGKRIHITLILLRVSFSIIFRMKLSRIANWVVFTAISLLDMPKPHRRFLPHTSGAVVCMTNSRQQSILSPGTLTLCMHCPGKPHSLCSFPATFILSGLITLYFMDRRAIYIIVIQK